MDEDDDDSDFSSTDGSCCCRPVEQDSSCVAAPSPKKTKRKVGSNHRWAADDRLLLCRCAARHFLVSACGCVLLFASSLLPRLALSEDSY